MQIAVLGAGLVGSAIAKDLALDPRFSVTAVDISQAALDRLAAASNLKTLRTDLSSAASIKKVAANADLVALAVPGFMGFNALEAVIESGVDVVDISFFPEDPFLLDSLAKANDVTAVVDCGVAPGLCNVMAGYLDLKLSKLTSYTCYVGGLPTKPEWPYGYRSVFSPIDVIEEYTRPARYVEGGKMVTREALSDIEQLNFSGVGTLEAFNTDGLRSLMRTLDAPDMKEKTLRWPGHAELMRIFRETGFFSEESMTVKGGRIAPIEVISKLLFDAWRMRDNEEDMTVLQVIIEGLDDGTPVRYTYDLRDVFHKPTRITSMARTTGYTCSLVARMVADDLYDHEGISPPEFVGRTEGCWEALLAGYAERDIVVTEQVERL